MTDTPETKEPASSAEIRRIERGDVLSGKYRVEKVLGEGGMGTVLEAMHVALEQRVAVKALLPQMAKREDAVNRFMREAKVLAKLNSEHVARVFDVGTAPDGPPFMVMEFLEGSDLAELVDTKGPLPIEDAAELALHACAGLAEVHAAGIIHRDMKPSNCYVVTRGDGTPCLKLLDFGISKFREAAVTRTAAIMGSPGYMSPEQMASTKDVDERADIWALGATFYEMLTGRPAFVAENAPMLCIKIASEEPDPPRDARADIPVELEAVVLRCLAKSPEKRYGSVAEVARAIAPFAPERARSYVEKIEGILRGARATPRSDKPPATSVFDRATARADAKSGAKSNGDSKRDRATKAESKAAKAALAATALPPVARARRGRGRMVIFALGTFLGAGVAAAYFGDVQKIRAHFEPRATLTAEPVPPPPPPPLEPAVMPSIVVSGALPIPAASTSSSALAAGAALDEDASADDDEDDEVDAGPSAPDAAPAAKHSAPRRKPRHHSPKRPRRR